MRVRLGAYGRAGGHGELFAGFDVHCAARMMGMAEGGQVIVTRATTDSPATNFRSRISASTG